MSKESADLILYNADVLTMNLRQPRVELVAVRDGKIVWVGDKDGLDLFDGRKVDCAGRTVAPGFNDAHLHIFAYASALLSVDCSPAEVTSISDIQVRIRQQAERMPPGTWIKAVGYNEFYLVEGRHPTRHDLDIAAPYHPVKLSHRSQHACVLNSLGLSLAGITIETPEPSGGLIDRDLETAEPSGLLFGMNSHISDKVIPPLGEQELGEGIKLANRSFLSFGITSVQDATVSNGFVQWQTLKSLKERGELAPRVCMMFGMDALVDFRERGMGAGFGDSELKLGMVKIVIGQAKGNLNPPQEELNREVIQAHEAGFQVAIHAIEETSVAAAITALEYCRCQFPETSSRHRVEHCSECPPELLRRLSKAGAVVVTQPSFIYYSGERYSHTVSEQQLPWLYRVRSFMEGGLRPAASSDCPVVPPNLLVGIYAAVTRRAENGQELLPEEAVTPAQALEMYTIGGAYASFEEGFKGSIEVGKAADLVILSADPTAVPLEEISDIRVDRTIINGKVVWER
ncbi:amidohydrolase [Chloroflexota bacterium]